MDELFFTQPILNSPYAYPDRHWELDADGQPTNRIVSQPVRVVAHSKDLKQTEAFPVPSTGAN